MKILKRVKPLYTIGRWKNAPVQIHWSLLLVLPWYYFSTGNLMKATIAMIAYAMLILIHEIGHAVIANWRNMRVYGITLYLVHGQCRVEAPYHEEDDIWLAWGGIFAQLFVLIVAILLSNVLHLFPYEARELLKPAFAVFIPLNLMTIVINLIPIRPLDGDKAWRFVPLFVNSLMAKRKKPVAHRKKRLKIVSRTQMDADSVVQKAIDKMMRE